MYFILFVFTLFPPAKLKCFEFFTLFGDTVGLHSIHASQHVYHQPCVLEWNSELLPGHWLLITLDKSVNSPPEIPKNVNH